jgi:hypothetical protein
MWGVIRNEPKKNAKTQSEGNILSHELGGHEMGDLLELRGGIFKILNNTNSHFGSWSFPVNPKGSKNNLEIFSLKE